MADPRISNDEVILEGWIYDLKAFSKVHPGGADALRMFGASDATTHYYMLHPHLELRSKALEPYKKVGAGSARGDIPFVLNSKSYQDLKLRVKKAIANPFAPWQWWIKAFIIFGTAVYLEFDSLVNGPTLVRHIILGIIMAMIGLCIQHDANHGAVSAYGWINQAWGYTQDWIGGSSILWRHHHVLMHHADTNVDGDDPDITGDLIRFHALTRWKGQHKWQAMYTWALLPLLGLKWHFAEMMDLVNMNHLGRPISKLAAGEVQVALALRVMFLVRFYVVPLLVRPTWHTLACLLATTCFGSMYLGVNFIISHNFEGVHSVLKQHDRSQHVPRDWSHEQVETSSTVGGWMLGVLHGGLNYQIEHHLFPRYSHAHYPRIAPIVKQWCEENKIVYRQFPTLWHNIRSTYRHLDALGRRPQHTGG